MGTFKGCLSTYITSSILSPGPQSLKYLLPNPLRKRWPAPVTNESSVCEFLANNLLPRFGMLLQQKNWRSCLDKLFETRGLVSEGNRKTHRLSGTEVKEDVTSNSKGNTASETTDQGTYQPIQLGCPYLSVFDLSWNWSLLTGFHLCQEDRASRA